jgi:hypothetical protein
MKRGLLLTILVAGLLQTTFAAIPKRIVDSVYICQSRSAYAYHAYECRGLARCTHGIIKITKAQAIKMGYRPCKICY